MIIMIKKILLVFLGVVFISNTFSQTMSFDSHWRFHRGGAQRAEVAEFDDSKWRSINLPHDWSIEDLPGKNSPFLSTAIARLAEGLRLAAPPGCSAMRRAFPADPSTCW